MMKLLSYLYMFIIFLSVNVAFGGPALLDANYQTDTVFLSSKTADLTKILGTSNNRVISLKNDGVYYVKKSIEVKGNITIIGNGSTISPVSNWGDYNETDCALISFVGVNKGEVRNVSFEFSGDKRVMKNRVYCGILVLSSTNVIIKDNVFRNGGLPISAKAVPNSPYIVIASQDNSGDLASLPKKYRNIIGSATNNVVSNNKFLNLKTQTRFGIRILTNWMLTKKQNAYKFSTSFNVIDKNLFEGDFIWNTVELAGGGTVKNKISNNTIKGKAVNNLDIDKGASYNEITGNTILNAGLPERYKNDKNVRCSPISVQGMSSKQYRSFGNVVKSNHIENVSNPSSNNSKYLFSSGIVISCADNTTIENNTMINLYQDGSFRNGQDYGYGIVINDYCLNVKILNNKIDKVYIGVATNLNKDAKINLVIENNVFNNVKGTAKFSPQNLNPHINKMNYINKISK